MDSRPDARVAAASLLALVVSAAPLGAVRGGLLLRLAGSRPLATAAALALASLALGAFGARWRHASTASLGLAAAAIAASPLALHAAIPRALGRLDAVPFGVNAELFAELYAAAAVGAALSVGAALAAALRADTTRPVALALAVVGGARALATGASALTLQAHAADAPTRLAAAAFVGWGGVLAGGAVLGWALRRRASRAGAALVGAVLTLTLALDESALRAWGAVGRPDLTEALRLPLLRGEPPEPSAPAVHLVATRGRLLTARGRTLPREPRPLAAWMSRVAMRHELPATDEGGDVRCAGGAFARAELVAAADASLSAADLAAIVAAAEEASVSTLTFLARLDDTAPGDTPRVRLSPPAVAAVRLLLSPMRRACPRPTANARLAPLPAPQLDALLRSLGGRGGDVVHPGGVLFTARVEGPGVATP